MQHFIQNVSFACITKGHHISAGPNSMLIQIVDPDMDFPTPLYDFKEIRQFKFLDLEGNEGYGEEFLITDQQAKDLVDALKYAIEHKMHVVVHCVAGTCRSGAVCEVGVMMGFADTETHRSPNLLVKHKMMRVLGWTYDNS